MMRFRTESLSGLHCTNRYGSMDHLMGRSSYRLCIGSTMGTNLNLPLLSSTRMNGSVTLQHAIEYMNSHEHTPVHTVKHTYVYKYTRTYYIRTQIYIHY